MLHTLDGTLDPAWGRTHPDTKISHMLPIYNPNSPGPQRHVGSHPPWMLKLGSLGISSNSIHVGDALRWNMNWVGLTYVSHMNDTLRELCGCLLKNGVHLDANN